MKLIALLGVCAWLSYVQIPVWRSDLTLWRHAHTHASTDPRVSLHYGLALLPNDREGGLIWLAYAVERAEGHPRGREITAVVKHRLLFLEAFGDPVCSRPFVQPVCSSF